MASNALGRLVQNLLAWKRNHGGDEKARREWVADVAEFVQKGETLGVSEDKAEWAEWGATNGYFETTRAHGRLQIFRLNRQGGATK